MNLVIGADVGTSALKAVLAEPATGSILAVAERPYPMHHPRPGWAENDPGDWYLALQRAIRDLLVAADVASCRVAALCVAGQRDPFVLLDTSGDVLTPSIHWSDQRDPDETQRLFESIGADRLIDTTGVPPTQGLVLPNLVWTRRHLPEAWARARFAVQPKDYLAFRLSGEVATDTSSPSRSLLNDWRRDSWSDDMCTRASIPLSILPPIRYQPWEVRGELTRSAAAELGLEAGVALVAGGGDDQTAALGAGVRNVGQVSIGTGSSLCWRIVTDAPQPDATGRMCLVRHVMPNRFLYEIIAVGTGTSLRWFRASLGGDNSGQTPSYEGLIAEAMSVPPGAEGVLFFPYLAGATIPHANHHASGVFWGIRDGHERRHFTRAILEGSAYLYPGFADIVTEHGARIDSITMVDGEARSGTWTQIKADVLRRPIRTSVTPEAAAVGSAILAAVAIGEYTMDAIGLETLVRLEEPTHPGPDAERYQVERARWEATRTVLFRAFDAAQGGAGASNPGFLPQVPRQ